MLLRKESIEETGTPITALADDDIFSITGTSVKKAGKAMRIPEVIKAVIDSSPVAMALCDAKGTALIANEPLYRLVDGDKRSVIGRSIYKALKSLKPLGESGKPQGMRQYAIYRALKTGRHIRGVTMLIGASPGKWTAFESSAIPLFNEGTTLLGGLAVFQDITMMSAFKEVGALSVTSANVDDLIEDSMDAIMNAFGLRTAWFYSYEPSSGELKLKAMKGEHSGVPGMPAIENPDQAHHGIISAAFN